MNTTTEYRGEPDRNPCPHYMEDSEWQPEFWKALKATGYEHRVCRNCGYHVERRPRGDFNKKVMDRLGVPHDSGFLLNQMQEILDELDAELYKSVTEDQGRKTENDDGESNDNH